ncbi:hypothetical protein [Glaciihabitans sp. GrIS 2.15]|uniref:hypothetical protein n=1 Tax=Glaciihabitans sp. GrIS 2.15 TaxID=3071710 RepID=UPI002E0B20C2|nr:hypothetical protein [Glaciihabitans sp. GrIS 2.15]
MDDKELDELLGRATTPLASSVSTEVSNLVDATREHSRPRKAARRTWSRSLVWGGVAAGAILLTAGASVVAAQMGIPPFQSIEDGTQRTTTAIPVDYVESDGHEVRCLAFMEFRNLDAAADSEIERFIKVSDWTGFGQGLFDSARAKATQSNTATTRLGVLVSAALFEKAAKVLPGLQRGPADTTDVIFNGSSMSCSPQGE